MLNEMVLLSKMRTLIIKAFRGGRRKGRKEVLKIFMPCIPTIPTAILTTIRRELKGLEDA